MVKHILGMSIYQSILVFALIFVGEYFIPDEVVTSSDGICYPINDDNPDSLLIHSGRLYDWDGEELYKQWEADCGSSRHFTIVFNVFVWLQIFNMLNARKINDELNIFVGIFENSMFLIVWFIIFVGQIVIA